MLLTIDVGTNDHSSTASSMASTLVHQFRVRERAGCTADEYAVQPMRLLQMNGIVDPQARASRDRRLRGPLAQRADALNLVERAFGQVSHGRWARASARGYGHPHRKPPRGRAPTARRCQKRDTTRAKWRRHRRGRLRHLDELRLRHPERRIPRRRARPRPPDQRGRPLRTGREAPARGDRQTSESRGAQHGPRHAIGHRLRLRWKPRVDGIVERIQAELGYRRARSSRWRAFFAHRAPLEDVIGEVDDHLTLTGLRLIHERNRG